VFLKKVTVIISILVFLTPKILFSKVYQISAGLAHTCALVDKKVYCWGAVKEDEWEISQGQADVPPLRNPRFVVAAFLPYSCAIDDDGVKCWGSSQFSQDNYLPYLKRPSQVGVGLDLLCAKDFSSVKCWGYFGWEFAPALSNVKEFASADLVGCAILEDKSLRCWGNRNVQELWKFPLFISPQKIVMGVSHACVLDVDGLKCWGNNFSRQLDVPLLRNIQAISVGAGNTCVIDDEGIKCWGDDTYGQVRHVPIIKNPRQISVGTYHICASDDKKILCWGNRANERTKVPDFLAFKKDAHNEN